MLSAFLLEAVGHKLASNFTAFSQIAAPECRGVARHFCQ